MLNNIKNTFNDIWNVPANYRDPYFTTIHEDPDSLIISGTRSVKWFFKVYLKNNPHNGNGTNKILARLKHPSTELYLKNKTILGGISLLTVGQGVVIALYADVGVGGGLFGVFVVVCVTTVSTIFIAQAINPIIDSLLSIFTNPKNFFGNFFSLKAVDKAVALLPVIGSVGNPEQGAYLAFQKGMFGKLDDPLIRAYVFADSALNCVLVNLYYANWVSAGQHFLKMLFRSASEYAYTYKLLAVARMYLRRIAAAKPQAFLEFIQAQELLNTPNQRLDALATFLKDNLNEYKINIKNLLESMNAATCITNISFVIFFVFALYNMLIAAVPSYEAKDFVKKTLFFDKSNWGTDSLLPWVLGAGSFMSNFVPFTLAAYAISKELGEYVEEAFTYVFCSSVEKRLPFSTSTTVEKIAGVGGIVISSGFTIGNFMLCLYTAPDDWNAPLYALAGVLPNLAFGNFNANCSVQGELQELKKQVYRDEALNLLNGSSRLMGALKDYCWIKNCDPYLAKQYNALQVIANEYIKQTEKDVSNASYDQLTFIDKLDLTNNGLFKRFSKNIRSFFLCNGEGSINNNESRFLQMRQCDDITSHTLGIN